MRPGLGPLVSGPRSWLNAGSNHPSRRSGALCWWWQGAGQGCDDLVLMNQASPVLGLGCEDPSQSTETPPKVGQDYLLWMTDLGTETLQWVWLVSKVSCEGDSMRQGFSLAFKCGCNARKTR